jgi:hypothetical protein
VSEDYLERLRDICRGALSIDIYDLCVVVVGDGYLIRLRIE